jgi:hypothetical protein
VLLELRLFVHCFATIIFLCLCLITNSRPPFLVFPEPPLLIFLFSLHEHPGGFHPLNPLNTADFSHQAKQTFFLISTHEENSNTSWHNISYFTLLTRSDQSYQDVDHTTSVKLAGQVRARLTKGRPSYFS